MYKQWPRIYTQQVRCQSTTAVQLSRPVGLPDPPKIGANTGEDNRTWEEKKADLVNYDKHLQKRQHLLKEFSTSYWKDVHEMRRNQGKLWIAPQRLFRAEKALYMPNFKGRTLASTYKYDTTPVIRKSAATILCLYTARLAEEHCKSFIDGLKPDTHLVDVQLQENPLKAALAGIFLGNIRKITPMDRLDKYFFVTNRINDEVKQAIGMTNNYTGYVYLLDRECKIRWAGCGDPTDEERESLLRGYEKLITSAP